MNCQWVILLSDFFKIDFTTKHRTKRIYAQKSFFKKQLNVMEVLLKFWWIPVLLILVIGYRYVFQLMGIVIVPEDRIGLVTKKFVLFGDKRELPAGRILATEGEAGYQAQTLPPGLHFWKWIWQYEITLQPLIIIPSGQIGLLVAKDGAELPKG